MNHRRDTAIVRLARGAQILAAVSNTTGTIITVTDEQIRELAVPQRRWMPEGRVSASVAPAYGEDGACRVVARRRRATSSLD